VAAAKKGKGDPMDKEGAKPDHGVHIREAAMANAISSSSSSTVNIIGGGITGAASALELARRGFSVRVLEKAIPGAEASSVAGGMLPPQAESDAPGPLLDLLLEARRRTEVWCHHLRETTQKDCGYQASGRLELAFDDDEVQGLRERLDWQEKEGLRGQWLEPGDVAKRWPAVKGDVLGGAFFPDDHHLDPRNYFASIKEAGEKAGVEFVLGGTVDGLLIEEGICRGVKAYAPNGEIQSWRADATLLCAGAWSTQIPGLGIDADAVFPIKGQIVQVQMEAPLFLNLIWARGIYLIPREDGRLLLGATMERQGFNKTPTVGAVQALLEAGMATLPELAKASFDSAWVGLRPGTQDNLPLLGASPVEGLFTNTGHHRNGILLAALAAELMADLLENKAPSLQLEEFSPMRFAGGATSK
jgi:glycine oxidase